MEYTSDSDVRADTRELVDQGFASVRRKRMKVVTKVDGIRERRSVPSTDIPSVRHQGGPEEPVDDASTHGLNPIMREIITGQNYNNINSTVLTGDHQLVLYGTKSSMRPSSLETTTTTTTLK